MMMPSESQLPGKAISSWDKVDSEIISTLDKINSEGGQIVLLTSSIISPSTKRLIQEFGAKFSNFKWVQYDAVSFSGILEANEEVFGKRVIPGLRFENAKTVVSFNADFLEAGSHQHISSHPTLPEESCTRRLTRYAEALLF